MLNGSRRCIGAQRRPEFPRLFYLSVFGSIRDDPSRLRMCRRYPQTINCGSNHLRYAADVGQGELVALKCRRQTLEALASGLIRYGSAAGAPDWLVSGVWLDAGQARYL